VIETLYSPSSSSAGKVHDQQHQQHQRQHQQSYKKNSLLGVCRASAKDTAAPMPTAVVAVHAFNYVLHAPIKTCRCCCAIYVEIKLK
jgi:hypothetical protein